MYSGIRVGGTDHGPTAMLSYNRLLGQPWIQSALPGAWAQAMSSSSLAIAQYAQNSVANSELMINVFFLI